MSTPEDQRSRSFGVAADTYDRFRPGPPPEAVDWLLPSGAAAVTDIGAGTGALTRVLVERVAHVSAVEPDARMAAVLRDSAPTATVLIAAAEALPLPDASQDGVLASSAWHWVDPGRAVPEVARVLRPGGRLAVVWTSIDRDDTWGAEINAILRRGRPAPTGQRRLELPDGAPFSAPEPHRVPFTITLDAAQLVGLATTYSAYLTLPADQQAALTAALREDLERHPRLAEGAADIPMVSRCWRSDRAGDRTPRPGTGETCTKRRHD